MREYGSVERRAVVDLVCDRCGFKASDEPNGFERQEFLSHHDTAGYASVFGDMNKVDLDLCQHCVKAALGDWIKITEADY